MNTPCCYSSVSLDVVLHAEQLVNHLCSPFKGCVFVFSYKLLSDYYFSGAGISLNNLTISHFVSTHATLEIIGFPFFIWKSWQESR